MHVCLCSGDTLREAKLVKSLIASSANSLPGGLDLKANPTLARTHPRTNPYVQAALLTQAQAGLLAAGWRRALTHAAATHRHAPTTHARRSTDRSTHCNDLLTSARLGLEELQTEPQALPFATLVTLCRAAARAAAEVGCVDMCVFVRWTADRSLSLFLFLSLSHSLTLTPSPSLSPSLPLSPSLSLPPSLPLPPQGHVELDNVDMLTSVASDLLYDALPTSRLPSADPLADPHPGSSSSSSSSSSSDLDRADHKSNNGSGSTRRVARRPARQSNSSSNSRSSLSIALRPSRARLPRTATARSQNPQNSSSQPRVRTLADIRGARRRSADRSASSGPARIRSGVGRGRPCCVRFMRALWNYYWS